MKKIVSLLVFLLVSVGVWAWEDGVPRELALRRAAEIANVKYSLHFRIPQAKEDRVMGKADISFLRTGKGDLVLDFQGKLAGVMTVNGKAFAGASVTSEHIVIPRRLLRKGENRVVMEFESNDAALNRHDDFLYTLFVPANARSVFPCFDQPDIKAMFSLSLALPEGWTSISSADPVRPIPTYLFSFAAGRFQRQTAVRDGRTLTALYRETDPQKVAQLGKCFDEIALAIRWMEQYTGIPYPFSSYGFVVLPGYPFGGMEHPGAIQYNDRRIFLGSQPTVDEELSRFQVIAHETAHMWFGDLVTMRWFDDVWTKEVFANFLASKMAVEQFPEVNHELNFLKSHYPAAISVDRTEGTHPIQQPLDNLKNAGLLYGNIIYHKAPIMMQKLEERMGEDALRRGLQRYLRDYSYGNATWDDLIAILGHEAPGTGIAEFDRLWVKQKGIELEAYGIERLDEEGVGRLSGKLLSGDLSDVDKFRAAMTLYENYLQHRGTPRQLVTTMLAAASKERNPLVASALVGYATAAIPYGDGVENAECELMRMARNHPLDGVRTQCLRYLGGNAVSPSVVDSVYAEWRANCNPLLSFADYTRMALHLAQCLPDSREAILCGQRGRLRTDDERAEFDFVSRGCNLVPAVQDSLFASLLLAESRRVEPWAASLLALLNNPVCEPQNNRFLVSALDALQDVQRTSAIFFPGDWLAALLGGHRSEEARSIVRQWISDHPDYPAPLMNKLKQNAYHLMVGR